MKKLKIIVFIAVFAALLIGMAYWMGQDKLNDFDQNGLFKTAKISKLYIKKERQSGARRPRWRKVHYADLSYLVKETDTRDGLKAEVEAEKTPEKKKTLDEMIANIGSKKINVDIGDYTTSSIRISKERYEELQDQKEVEILYIKGEPQRAILKSQVD